jgi:oligosaccharide repeat unit polymerase
MYSLVFVIGFLIIPSFSLFLMYKSNIKLLKPSIPSIFLWAYLCFAYIGILPLFFFWNDYRYTIGINNQEKIFYLWILSSLGLLIIVFIIYLLSKIQFFKEDEEVPADTKENLRLKIFMGILFIGVILVLAVYLSKIPRIPIIEELLGASASDVAKYRSLATNGFDGKLHWYRLIYAEVLTLISYYAFVMVYKNRSLYNILFFAATFSVRLFTSIMTTQKGPLIWYIIGMIIVYLIMTRKTLNLKYIVGIFSFVFVTLILMYKYIMGLSNRPIGDVVQAFLSRAFTGQISPAYFYLELFPEKREFMLGQSFPNPMGIFPWEPVSITREVAKYMNPTIENTGVVASAPTVYWGEMYANFGIGGVIISSLALGVILYLCHIVLSRLKVNALTVAYSTWIILYFKNLVFTSFSAIFLDIDLIIITILFGAGYILTLNRQTMKANIMKIDIKVRNFFEKELKHE